VTIKTADMRILALLEDIFYSPPLSSHLIFTLKPGSNMPTPNNPMSHPKNAAEPGAPADGVEADDDEPAELVTVT
jgi:hypothetical protein